MISTSPTDTTQTNQDTILAATRGVHAPPEMRAGSGSQQRRFVLTLLAACLVVVGAVGAVNALVDPYATLGSHSAGPAIWTDRQIKADLIEDLPAPPHLVILGSSRAIKIEPRFATRLTGEPAFNAAVSNGMPVDAYAFTRFLHDRYPQTPETYLWLLDQEAFAPEPIHPGTLSTKQLARYLPGNTQASARLTGISWLFSWRTLKVSLRSLRHELEPEARLGGARRGPRPRAEFLPDGCRVYDMNDRSAAKGRTLEQGVNASYATFGKRYRSRYPGLAATQQSWFEKTLTMMNSWGSAPVLVLSPVHPRLLAELRPLGWEQRHRQVLAYLKSLQPRYRFVLVDMSNVDSFGGSPRLFFDGVHMKIPNYRRLLKTVLANHDAAAALGAPL